MDNNFKRAKEIEIFDGNGKKWEGMKGLVNEANELNRFAIVGEGYKVVQHQEVMDIIAKALEDLKLNTKTTTIEMKDGARLRINLNFPEIQHSIAGEKLEMWASFDNSYDSSTGLRLEVNAYLPITETNLYCSEVVSEALNRYYHKHTKGLEVSMLEGTINKGVELFQTKIKAEFENLLSIPVNALQAKAFIQEMIEGKTVKTAKKYLEMVLESLNNPNVSDKLHNAWGFYTLISRIFTKEVASIDTRKNNSREMLNRIKNNKWAAIVQVIAEESQQAELCLEINQ